MGEWAGGPADGWATGQEGTCVLARTRLRACVRACMWRSENPPPSGEGSAELQERGTNKNMHGVPLAQEARKFWRNIGRKNKNIDDTSVALIDDSAGVAQQRRKNGASGRARHVRSCFMVLPLCRLGHGVRLNSRLAASR